MNWEWLAGFWEGEGSVGCYLRKEGKYKSYIFTVSMSQNELPILLKIQKFLAGIGSITKRINVHKSHLGGIVYSYTISNSYALWFCNKIKPLLQTNKKRKQLQIALSRLIKLRKRKKPLAEAKGA